MHSLNVVSAYTPPLFVLIPPLSASQSPSVHTHSALSTDTALLNSAPTSVVCALPDRCLHISSRCLHTSSRSQRTDISLSYMYSALTSVLSVGLCISFVEQCTHARTLRTQSPAHNRCTLSRSLRTSLPELRIDSARGNDTAHSQHTDTVHSRFTLQDHPR